MMKIIVSPSQQDFLRGFSSSGIRRRGLEPAKLSSSHSVGGASNRPKMPSRCRDRPETILAFSQIKGQINKEFPQFVKFFLTRLDFRHILGNCDFFAEMRVHMKEEKPRGSAEND